MDALKTLKEHDVLKTGHFLLPSGKHSGMYFQCAQLFKYPDKLNLILEKVVRDNRLLSLDFDLIVSPAVGGLLVGYELSRQMKKPFIYTEKKDGLMILSEEFEIGLGQRILIAEDVITSGNTVRDCIELLTVLGGQVIGVVCIINKENIKLTPKIYSFLNLNFKSYDNDECPFCKKKLLLKTGKEL